MRLKLTIAALLLTGLCFPTTGRAATYEIHAGEDLFGVLGTLQAGDEVIVYDGTYDRPGYVMLDLQGTATLPIIIRAADGNTPLITGSTNQNILNITGYHFTFKGFEMTGGSHGLRLYNVHDALIEDLHIHDTQEVALSANIGTNEYYNITFRGLHLHHTGGHGEGMYLGCNHAECEFYDNVIENCYIHNTAGGSQGDGIEIKQGSYGNLVRNNVIHDTKYPCIIVYGTQGHARNVIENNVMWNCGDSGIQAASDAELRNNIILNAGNGINSHDHDGAEPSNLIIVHNTVIGCTDRCLRASNWDGSTGIVVVNNVFYNEGGNAIRLAAGESDIEFHHNLVLGGVEGITAGTLPGNSAAADFTDVAGLDVWPTDTSPVIDAGDPALGVTVDFNWDPRDSAPDIGAYEWQAGGNPGWDVEPGFRDTDGGVPPTPDASVPGPDSSTPGADAAPGTDGSTPGTDAGTDPNADDSGCGCRTSSSTNAPLLLLLLAALLWIRRRRRRRAV